MVGPRRTQVLNVFVLTSRLSENIEKFGSLEGSLKVTARRDEWAPRALIEVDTRRLDTFCGFLNHIQNPPLNRLRAFPVNLNSDAFSRIRLSH